MEYILNRRVPVALMLERSESLGPGTVSFTVTLLEAQIANEYISATNVWFQKLLRGSSQILAKAKSRQASATKAVMNCNATMTQ